jgi:AAA domain
VKISTYVPPEGTQKTRAIDAGQEPASKAEGNGLDAASGAQRPKFPLIPFNKITFKTTEEWLVKKLLPRKGVGAFYGASGSVKMFILVDLGLQYRSVGHGLATASPKRRLFISQRKALTGSKNRSDSRLEKRPWRLARRRAVFSNRSRAKSWDRRERPQSTYHVYRSGRNPARSGRGRVRGARIGKCAVAGTILHPCSKGLSPYLVRWHSLHAEVPCDALPHPGKFSTDNLVRRVAVLEGF